MKTIKIATSYLLLGAVPLAFTASLMLISERLHMPSILIDALLVLNFFAYVAAATVTTIKVIRTILATGLKAGILRIASFLFGVILVILSCQPNTPFRTSYIFRISASISGEILPIDVPSSCGFGVCDSTEAPTLGIAAIALRSTSSFS